MKKFYILTLAALFFTSGYVFSQKEAQHQKEADRAKLVNTRVDNNGYWRKMAALGLAKLNPVAPVKPATYVGSDIKAFSVLTEDSPDVPVAGSGSTQSENSIFVNPNDNQVAINSNNSTPNPVTDIYGANSTESYDGGLTWDGSVQGAGGSNSGDPVALIGLDGTYYIGYINNGSGQSVSVSTNQGATYSAHLVANAGGELLDKNHMWIDNCSTSPYSNHLYDAWTDFHSYDPNDGQIGFSYSTNNGTTWSSVNYISTAINAGSHNQGVNITSGPNGEVYVIWAIYDDWPTDETAIGMAKSLDGGVTFAPATRVINNIRGIRTTGLNKTMRCNSFPSMTCDISNREYKGNIYIVWTNVGVPGINTGNDIDVYMARSEDQGVTWSTPIKVNQDPIGLGRQHYFPWITCDPKNGMLSVVFYDDRNVGAGQAEVFAANSSDAGLTWEDFKVSDVAFTPSPIPGLADNYMGDYLGISAYDGWVYPAWADNRTGTVMTYVSPYQTNPLNKPSTLAAQVTFETGITDMHWHFETMEGFSYFKIYRGVDSIGMALDTIFSDQLPDYGVYQYKVTARYVDGGESSSANASVQWGDAQISVDPVSIEETMLPDSSLTKVVHVNNIGQLEMNYNITMFIPSDASADSRTYCASSGGCDEYISRVQLNEINNLSLCTGYGNYTGIYSTSMSVGSSYQITVTNGTPSYPEDQCGVWVDWNQNELFDDNEMVEMYGSPGVGPYTAMITPPAGAVPGETRLRARIVYYQTPIPCGDLTYGETEDYTVNVLSWLFADPVAGAVPAGQSMDINVSLNSIGLDYGTYTAELRVFSNDPDNPEILVPITLNVAEMAANVSSDFQAICPGEPVELTSTVFGGSGTFTYTWTSDPAGFSSSEAIVTVNPVVTTTYHLEVSDGTLFATDQFTILVHPSPVVNLGADATICQGQNAVLNAGEGFTSYLWSTGETTPTIEASVQGSYSVTVTNEFNCSASDTLNLTVTQFPVKPVIASGPATVDNYVATTSTYTVAEDPNATSYQWAVTPAAAGTTSSTGMDGEFSWAAGFTGSVQVTATGVNDCATSEVSNAFSTVIYTSQGLNEISGDGQIIIYPNPTDGKITLSLPSQKAFSGDLTLTEAGGAVVYNRASVTISEGNNLTLDLGQLSKGIYSLKLTSKSAVYSGRVILK
jgi:hypothetical protein